MRRLLLLSLVLAAVALVSLVPVQEAKAAGCYPPESTREIPGHGCCHCYWYGGEVECICDINTVCILWTDGWHCDGDLDYQNYGWFEAPLTLNRLFAVLGAA